MKVKKYLFLGLSCGAIFAGQNLVTADTKLNSADQPFGSVTRSEEVIRSGVWGTSNWEYVHSGNDYILKFHRGTLGTGMIKQLGVGDSMTRIEIDPGVVAPADSSYMFFQLSGLKQIDGLRNLDTSNVTNMSHMFRFCGSLTSIDVSNFNTSKVTNMNCMLADLYSISSLDVSNFDTSNVVDMGWMFRYLPLSNVDISHFDTSKVTSLIGMFSFSKLKDIDLSNFDTSHVTDIRWLFQEARNLNNLNLSTFDTSSVRVANYMFENDYNLNHIILGPKANLNFYGTSMPNVPAKGTSIPGSDKVVGTPTWVVTSGSYLGKTYTTDELLAISNRDQVTSYDWNTAPNFDLSYESKAVTRTINVHQPDDSVKVERQTATIKRSVKVNDNGSKTYGAWSKATWEAYNLPKIKGYEPNESSVPVQVIDENTQDTMIEVYYDPIEQNIAIQYVDGNNIVKTQTYAGYYGDVITPNYHAPRGYEIVGNPQSTITVDDSGNQIIRVNIAARITQSSESKTVVRTVNVHRPEGSVKSYNQVAVLTRNVYTNMVNRTKTYGEWSKGNWDRIDVTSIVG